MRERGREGERERGRGGEREGERERERKREINDKRDINKMSTDLHPSYPTTSVITLNNPIFRVRVNIVNVDRLA